MEDLREEERVEELLKLLDLERDYEADQYTLLGSALRHADLERLGVALSGMTRVSLRGTLGGRVVVEFARQLRQHDPDFELPSHQLRVGAPVSVRGGFGGGGGEAAEVRGVVVAATRARVKVALPAGAEPAEGQRVVLALAGDGATYKRCRRALQALHGSAAPEAFRAALWRPETRALAASWVPEGVGAPGADALAFGDASLNASQREAVRLAVLRPAVYTCVHGPPGTGKTRCLAEIVHQLVQRGQRVLVSAPSNVAVDNVLERLLLRGVTVARAGHPARVSAALQAATLDALLARSDAGSLAADARRDLRAAADAAGRREARREVKRWEARALAEALAHCAVVGATLAGAGARELREQRFDVVVVDEAGQATEPATWVALAAGKAAGGARARRCVLAGDHLQLPPTVLSPEAARGGLAASLFARLVRDGDPARCVMLERQYRMHEDIMRWASGATYEGRLVADESVRLRALPAAADADAMRPLVFVDTAAAGTAEEEDCARWVAVVDEAKREALTAKFGGSKKNEEEARLVAAHVRSLVDAGVPTEDIGVITPYNAQARVLRAALADAGVPGLERLEVGSVDGFQGREKEAIVVSLVRANARAEVGFLAEDRRMNVALTRARRHLCVVGDSSTLASHPYLERFMEYAAEHGSYLTEEMELSGGPVVAAEAWRAERQRRRQEQPRRSRPPDAPSPRVLECQARIRAMVADAEARDLVLEKGLTSAERRLLHAFCEDLRRAGLHHLSLGEGEDRVLRVWKGADFVQDAPSQAPAPAPPDAGGCAEAEKPTAAAVAEGEGEGDAPATEPASSGSSAAKLHKLARKLEAKEAKEKEKKLVAAAPRAPADATKEAVSVRAQQERERLQRQEEKKKEKELERVKEVNLEAYKEALVEERDLQLDKELKDPDAAGPSAATGGGSRAKPEKIEGVCPADGCATNIKFTGGKCKVCQAKFCFTHLLPEKHGCGAEAVRQARMEWLERNVGYHEKQREELKKQKHDENVAKLRKAVEEKKKQRQTKQRNGKNKKK